MTDLTITIPLSWLSFLTWSGFWVVYLYIGLGWFVWFSGFAISKALKGQMRVIEFWHKPDAPLWVAVTMLGWPYLLGVGIWWQWRRG